MPRRKRTWPRSRPSAFDHLYEKLEKSVSETGDDNMVAAIRRRLYDPDFACVKLDPHLQIEILDGVLRKKGRLQDMLVKQYMELEWLREQLVKVEAELRQRKRRMLNSNAAVEES